MIVIEKKYVIKLTKDSSTHGAAVAERKNTLKNNQNTFFKKKNISIIYSIYTILLIAMCVCVLL